MDAVTIEDFNLNLREELQRLRNVYRVSPTEHVAMMCERLLEEISKREPEAE